jgi:hypothetical protein
MKGCLMNPQNEYTYEQAGFDGFLSRSIDNLSQVNLDSAGPQSTAIRYDSAQVSGLLGNTIRIGSIYLDGVKGRISIYDGNNEVIRLGELDG